jgi:hypothetical protein
MDLTEESYMVYLATLSMAEIIKASNGQVIVNNELERTDKEASTV